MPGCDHRTGRRGADGKCRLGRYRASWRVERRSGSRCGRARCTRPQPHGQPHDLCVLWLSVLEGLPPGAACERHSEHLQLEVVAARGGLVEEAQPHVAARFTGGAAVDGGGGGTLGWPARVVAHRESSTPRSAVIDTRRPPLLGRECASSTNGSHRQEPKHDTAARPCLSYEVR